MTHRLKSLEAKGWIERVPNAQDARSMLVQLTHKGRTLIDRAVEAHIDNERQILSALPAAALAELDIPPIRVAAESGCSCKPRSFREWKQIIQLKGCATA